MRLRPAALNNWLPQQGSNLPWLLQDSGGHTMLRPPLADVAATVGGVRFIDDSKATNIGALQAALAGCETPVVLIAGP